MQQFVERVAVRTHSTRDLFKRHTPDTDFDQCLALFVGELGGDKPLQTLQEEALNCLLMAISERNGFVVITGEIGSGKTTVCRILLNKLDPATKVTLILNTHLGKKELLTTILEDLEIEYKSPQTDYQLFSQTE